MVVVARCVSSGRNCGASRSRPCPHGQGYAAASNCLAAALILCSAAMLSAAPAVLKSDGLLRHVARFNAMEDEPIVNLVPNAEASGWLQTNIPLFECPDAEVEEIYFF